MVQKDPKTKDLKIFFIKLISISIAIIIVTNVLFNLITSSKLKSFDTLLSLTEVENRREHGNKLRNDLNDLLEKDELINKEDRVLIYRLYQKLRSEFEGIKQ